MQQADIPSFRALAHQAGVSEWQVRQLRQGNVAQMRLENVLKISEALGVGWTELVNGCSAIALPQSKTMSVDVQGKQDESKSGEKPTDGNGVLPARSPDVSVDKLKAEYERLQGQFADQQNTLLQDFQRTSLQTLESWMTYWPAAVYAAEKNPDLPANRLVPLVRPVEQLLSQWGVEAIAPVGSNVPYNPQQHQLIDGTANPGDPVYVKNPGYTHNGALLHRANVRGK
ncbi:MAG: helix-turn-helix domain-containing protein [Merismopedia sp. SIO2A8]|nr:helix-turn-helix domain-containing protein [Merismopedia sp. SIO2A8]